LVNKSNLLTNITLILVDVSLQLHLYSIEFVDGIISEEVIVFSGDTIVSLTLGFKIGDS
jgi:hypothetical protein